ncbi:glycosyltransferase family 4 protein [Croceicoccus naphthovorans]|uniref:Uncharacterized protein n=1 Tax=Croceicoccus naphthovorans TaxID=1348774 RepID=A0A0G3XF49_9SPHN|nr:glycosyltransferase family 4 protein [Croceicoccus naphthovorans]AKM09229.1 hypothetical protein AB433_03390 [Croceicoccus naphthovorans]MBB3990383.1 glycosyltransferase involved in cell wall biosynthesis [Croceicoccus naphthovorans]
MVRDEQEHWPRVLHVSEVLPGGVGRYIDELSRAQAADAGPGQVAVLGPEGQLDTMAPDPAVRYFGYRQAQRGVGGLASLARALRRTVLEFRPDVVHLHSSFAGLVGRLIGTGVATVYTAHGWAIDPDRPARFRPAMIATERALARRCDAVINISPHEMAFLGEMGFPADRMRLVLTGLGNAAMRTSPAPVGGDGPLRLLFVGRLDPQKGFDLLWPELVEAAPGNLHVRVAGTAMKGGGGAGYRPLPNVEFLGWVDHAEVQRQLGWADALIMPSRWEGMPLAALEAMRAGRAVLSSDRSAFRSIVEHGVSGLRLDIDRPGFLARALEGVTRADLVRMGAAGRARIECDFRHDRMVREIWDVYREVVAP